MVKNGIQRRFFTTGDVARYCQVNVNTVKRWIRNGQLKAFKTPSGHFRVIRENFIQFVKKYGYPLESRLLGKREQNVDILIIDDDPSHLQLVTYLIHRFNESLTVATAGNGVEGFKMIDQMKPKLVLLDLNMPDISGMDLTKMVRSQESLAETRIGIISAFLDAGLRKSLARLQVVRIITKPIQVDQLMGLYQHVFGNS